MGEEAFSGTMFTLSHRMQKSRNTRNSIRDTPSSKRTVEYLAKKYGMDSDDALIILWDYSRKPRLFEYIKNGQSVVRAKHFFVADDVLSSQVTQTSLVPQLPPQNPPKLIYKPFDFSTVGVRYNSISYIEKGEVLKIHQELTADVATQADPILPSGLKDEQLLDSALFHPQTGFEGASKYSTVESVAAALMYAISHNHAFHNGNKRTAIVAMMVFLDRHNMHLTCNEDELFKISLAVADHKTVSEEYRYSDAEIFQLAKWIHSNSRVMTKGERPITLRKFKTLLANFDCVVTDNGRISRDIITTGFLGRKIHRTILSKKGIPNTMTDGAEVSPILVKAIRQDLELSAEHGVDSDAFYAQTEVTSSEFIIKYSKLLRRLSRV